MRARSGAAAATWKDEARSELCFANRQIKMPIGLLKFLDLTPVCAENLIRVGGVRELAILAA